MCGQAIEKWEKWLKAYYVFVLVDTPLHIHGLSRLASLFSFFNQLSEEQKGLLDLLSPLNIQALLHASGFDFDSLSQEKCEQLIGQTKELDVECILLYGSYAKGTPHENSDVDIAVIVNSIGEDYLAEQAKLFRLRRAIDLRIEPVLFLSGIDDSGT